jgi:hypothetical protein
MHQSSALLMTDDKATLSRAAAPLLFALLSLIPQQCGGSRIRPGMRRVLHSETSFGFNVFPDLAPIVDG